MADRITEPALVDRIIALAESAGPRCGATTVIAVDGHSGAGKTSLAAALVAALPEVGAVHLERIYPGWDGLAETPALLATTVLEPIRRTGRAAYETWDWGRGAWGSRERVGPCRVLVVEGCGASVGPARPYASVTVFLDADPSTRRDRAIARDGETYRPHWERWAAQEDDVFTRDRTRVRADLLIDTTASGYSV